MSEVLPTIKIKHKDYGIEMVINVSDFDSEKHEILEQEKNKKKVFKNSSKSVKDEDEDEDLRNLLRG